MPRAEVVQKVVDFRMLPSSISSSIICNSYRGIIAKVKFKFLTTTIGEKPNIILLRALLLTWIKMELDDDGFSGMSV